jgi:hypothetical protein
MPEPSVDTAALLEEITLLRERLAIAEAKLEHCGHCREHYTSLCADSHSLLCQNPLTAAQTFGPITPQAAAAAQAAQAAPSPAAPAQAAPALRQSVSFLSITVTPRRTWKSALLLGIVGGLVLGSAGGLLYGWQIVNMYLPE